MDITLPINFIVTWAVFGIVIGVLAHLLDREKVRGRLLGTVLASVIGAVLGGLAGNLVFGISQIGVNAESFGVALVGAIILVIAERVIFRKSEHIKTKVTRIN